MGKNPECNIKKEINNEQGIIERDPFIRSFIFPIFEQLWKEEIDEMVTTLSETVDHLVLKADKTKLEELISKIDALDMSKYENIDSLITVLNQSKEVLMNEEATQSEVDQAYEMLNASYKQLKLKSDNIEITEIPTQSTNKTDKNEQIKTGDTTYVNMIGWSLLIMLSCLGIFFIRKRMY